LKFLDFILCNDEINILWKRSKKMVDERGRDKKQICKWWKIKYEITTVYSPDESITFWVCEQDRLHT
jgi:hypothetical protein